MMPPVLDLDRSRAIPQMILIHENILMVLKSKRLNEVVNRLFDAEFRAEAAADPFQVARDYDIHLPQHSNVYFHDFPDDSWSVEIVVTGQGRTTFGFNSLSGFFSH
jgi:hypothetical protein